MAHARPTLLWNWLDNIQDGYLKAEIYAQLNFIADWQQAHGLKDDGLIGLHTIAKADELKDRDIFRLAMEMHGFMVRAGLESLHTFRVIDMWKRREIARKEMGAEHLGV